MYPAIGIMVVNVIFSLPPSHNTKEERKGGNKAEWE